MGGAIPYGYDLRDRCLIVNEAEAEKIRTIYQLYLELGCVSKLQVHLESAGIRSKKRLSKTGKATGDALFSRGALYELLQNPLYLGQVRHKEKVYPGQHPAIVDQKTFDKVKQQLAFHRPLRVRGKSGTDRSILTGLLFDADGNRFTPSHTTKNGRRYRYYVSQVGMQQSKRRGSSPLRILAQTLEQLVMNELNDLLRSPERLGQMVSDSPSDPAELSQIVKALSTRGVASASSSSLLMKIHLGCARRYLHLLTTESRARISSFFYFKNVVSEVTQAHVSDDYWDYISYKLQVFEERWKSSQKTA